MKKHTEIFDLKNPEQYAAGIIAAAAAVKGGELVVFPTETVYGLGANALDPMAVRSIYEAKGRPSDNPLIVHLSDFAEAEKYVSVIPENARILAKAYMPGPITLIMPKADCIPDIVSGGGSTVGIRVPESRMARDFLAACALPVAAPSANISGRPSPTSEAYAIEDMNGRAAVILLGGDCDIGVESTVVDCTGEAVRVLRPGRISAAELSELVPVDAASLSDEEREHPKAPGMKYRHYKPRGEVVVLCGSDQDALRALAQADVEREDCAVLAYDSVLEKLNCPNKLSLGSRGDYSTAAHNLFAHFRRCDDLGIARIYVMAAPNIGIGAAYMNRLLKAADQIIEPSAKRLLFVCTGNTCRSPMAEAILNSRGNGRLLAKSAGLFAESGSPANEKSIVTAKAHGLSLDSHRAQNLSAALLDEADLVLCMTKTNAKLLCSRFPEYSEKVFTLAEYAGKFTGKSLSDVADPYGGSLSDYEAAYRQLESYIEMIINSEGNTIK